MALKIFLLPAIDRSIYLYSNNLLNLEYYSHINQGKVFQTSHRDDGTLREIVNRHYGTLSLRSIIITIIVNYSA